MNTLVIAAVLVLYYLIFMLRAGNVILDKAATDSFSGFNIAISLTVIAIVLCYAIRYAGNPTLNSKTRKIIQGTRKVIIFYTLTRLVVFLLT